jgi:hypothetical protein
MKMRWRRCPHQCLRGVYGDEVNQYAGGYRLQCRDCGKYLDGPVSLAQERDCEKEVAEPPMKWREAVDHAYDYPRKEPPRNTTPGLAAEFILSAATRTGPSQEQSVLTAAWILRDWRQRQSVKSDRVEMDASECISDELLWAAAMDCADAQRWLTRSGTDSNIPLARVRLAEAKLREWWKRERRRR